MMDVYVLTAKRSPIGKFGGVFKSLSPVDLAVQVAKQAIAEANVDASLFDMSIFGNVIRGLHGQNIARQIGLKAGLPYEKDGFSVDMVCSSGMMSIILAENMIRSGDADLILAGGVESMSQSPYCLKGNIRWGVKMLMNEKLMLEDEMLVDGLVDPFNGLVMGQEADMLSKELGYQRGSLDEVAFESHVRAAKTTDSGVFKNEIVPIMLNGLAVNIDEGIRRDTSLEKLSALKPAFSKEGLHTAGNSSQISDGAASLVLASEKAVKEMSLAPIAKIIGHSWAGVETYKFPLAPVISTKKLLDKTRTSIKDYDYFENNEAFAVSTLIYRDQLNIDPERLNIFGGAIALGHPIGASGARLVVTLINVLKTMKGKKGIASLCHGLGGATSLGIELV
ncbi:MAG: thiolase family protein [Nitrososphaeria archaeon]